MGVRFVSNTTTSPLPCFTLVALRGRKEKGGTRAARGFFERLNTPIIALVVLVVIVAVNAYLFFGNYLPRTSSTGVLVGAGDIATCPGTGDEATAKLLDGISGTVFTTGD